MPFRCLRLQKNFLRPLQFSESFVRTKFPLTRDPGCLYVAPWPFHFFAFSPSSTSRRMASEREMSLEAAQASTSLNKGSRTVTAGSRPVAGLPTFFFWCTLIDLLIN